jgi:hypothetical protein
MAKHLKWTAPAISLVPRWIFVTPCGLRQTPSEKFQNTVKICPVRAPIPRISGNSGCISAKCDINSSKYNSHHVGKHETLFGCIWTAKKGGGWGFAHHCIFSGKTWLKYIDGKIFP